MHRESFNISKDSTQQHKLDKKLPSTLEPDKDIGYPEARKCAKSILSKNAFCTPTLLGPIEKIGAHVEENVALFSTVHM